MAKIVAFYTVIMLSMFNQLAPAQNNPGVTSNTAGRLTQEFSIVSKLTDHFDFRHHRWVTKGTIIEKVTPNHGQEYITRTSILNESLKIETRDLERRQKIIFLFNPDQKLIWLPKENKALVWNDVTFKLYGHLLHQDIIITYIISTSTNAAEETFAKTVLTKTSRVQFHHMNATVSEHITWQIDPANGLPIEAVFARPQYEIQLFLVKTLVPASNHALFLNDYKRDPNLTHDEFELPAGVKIERLRRTVKKQQWNKQKLAL